MYAGWQPGSENAEYLMIEVKSGQLRFTGDLGAGMFVFLSCYF